MAFIGFLKQSTTVTISLGPCVDKDDGDTEKTGLTIADTTVFLSKNGAAKAVPNDTNDCTEDANGVYRKQLNTTDTNTIGILTVYVHQSDVLYLRQDYAVLSANVYDWLFAADGAGVLYLKRLYIDNNGSAGDGFYCRGGTNGAGVTFIGQGTGCGISASAEGTGYGLSAQGGATSGAGIYAAARGGNDNGMTLTKHGTGKDIDADEIDNILASAQAGIVIPAGDRGDYKAGETINFLWATWVTADTAGTIKIYKDNGTTAVSAPTGITDTRNFNSLTDVHLCTIDTNRASNTFYEPRADYQVVVEGMVEGGQTINAVIATFSIENRFAGIEYLKSG